MSLIGKRLFITGGGGFIGSTLCARLVEDNEIVIYDNGRRDALRFGFVQQVQGAFARVGAFVGARQ